MGYRARGLPSPYLWSGSQHYARGKFVADGRFDARAVSSQVGAAVVLRRMETQALIDTPAAPDEPPLATALPLAADHDCRSSR